MFVGQNLNYSVGTVSYASTGSTNGSGDNVTIVIDGEGSNGSGDNVTTVIDGEGSNGSGDNMTTVIDGEGSNGSGDNMTTVIDGEGSNGSSDNMTTVIDGEGSNGSDNTVAIVVGVTVPIVIIAGAVIALVALLLFALRLKHGNSSYSVSKRVEAVELLEGNLATVIVLLI